MTTIWAPPAISPPVCLGGPRESHSDATHIDQVGRPVPDLEAGTFHPSFGMFHQESGEGHLVMPAALLSNAASLDPYQAHMCFHISFLRGLGRSWAQCSEFGRRL